MRQQIMKPYFVLGLTLTVATCGGSPSAPTSLSTTPTITFQTIEYRLSAAGAPSFITRFPNITYMAADGDRIDR